MFVWIFPYYADLGENILEDVYLICRLLIISPKIFLHNLLSALSALLGDSNPSFWFLAFSTTHINILLIFFGISIPDWGVRGSSRGCAGIPQPGAASSAVLLSVWCVILRFSAGPDRATRGERRKILLYIGKMMGLQFWLPRTGSNSCRARITQCSPGVAASTAAMRVLRCRGMCPLWVWV